MPFFFLFFFNGSQITMRLCTLFALCALPEGRSSVIVRVHSRATAHLEGMGRFKNEITSPGAEFENNASTNYFTARSFLHRVNRHI
jgi:hypothetical protein